MFSVLYRYIFTNLLKSFLFWLIAFFIFAILLQMNKITNFSSSGLSVRGLFLLFLFQIPVILPHIIAFAGLLSSFLALRHLQNSHELTAMRSLGFSIRAIFHPIVAFSFITTMLSFLVVSEIIPLFKLFSYEVLSDKKTKPFVLIKSALEKYPMKNLYQQMILSKKGNQLIKGTFVVEDHVTKELKCIQIRNARIHDYTLHAAKLQIHHHYQNPRHPFEVSETRNDVHISLANVIRYFDHPATINYYSTFPMKGLLHHINKKQFLEIICRIAISCNVFFQILIGACLALFSPRSKIGFGLFLAAFGNFVLFFTLKSLFSIVVTPLLFMVTFVANGLFFLYCLRQLEKANTCENI